MRFTRLFAFCAAVLIGVTGHAVHADERDADRDAARDAAREALRLYEAGRYRSASAYFAHAQRLYKAPTIGLYMARCQAKMGNLLAARALYREVADEVLTTDAPQQYREAQASSRAELSALLPRIPTVNVVVVVVGPVDGARREQPVDADRANVTIDDKPLPAGAGGRAELNPGVHTFAANAPGAEPRSLRVEVTEGGSHTIELKLQAVAPAIAAWRPDTPSGVASDGAQPNWQRLAGVATVAVGAGFIGLFNLSFMQVHAVENDPRFTAYRKQHPGQEDVCEAAAAGRTSEDRYIDGRCSKARTYEVLQVVSIPAAAAAITTGVFLIARSGADVNQSGRAVNLVTGFGPGGGRLNLIGRF